MKTNSTQRQTLHMLCEGAIMVVLAQILGYIKVWEMPWAVRLGILVRIS